MLAYVQSNKTKNDENNRMASSFGTKYSLLLRVWHHLLLPF